VPVGKHKAPSQRWTLAGHPYPFRDMTVQRALTRSFLRWTVFRPCRTIRTV